MLKYCKNPAIINKKGAKSGQVLTGQKGMLTKKTGTEEKYARSNVINQ